MSWDHDQLFKYHPTTADGKEPKRQTVKNSVIGLNIDFGQLNTLEVYTVQHRTTTCYMPNIQIFFHVSCVHCYKQQQ